MTSHCQVLLALVFLAATSVAHADGYTELLARYDLNGNGLLEPHERAQLTAAKANEASALAALPLVCDGDSAGEPASAGGASADDENDVPSAPARVARLHGEQFAQQLPQNGDQHDDAEAEAQAAAPAYEPQEPAPTQPRQVVQIRNAVKYRMLLNEQRVQSRPQPFAQAATFGPMVGRTKMYPRRAYAHVGCAPSRASFYLARY